MASVIHAFNIDIAQEYGIEEAILIQHFQYWISHNQQLKRHFLEGRTWTYQTHEEIAAHFPYLNERKVKYIVENLVEKGVLIKGNFNTNKLIKTTWYAFKNEEMFTKRQNCLIDRQNCLMEKTNLSHVYTHTDTNTCFDVSGDGGSEALERSSQPVNLKKDEIKVRGPKGTSTTLTKDGIKATAAIKQYKWEDDEIEYAFEVMANHKDPISNWLAFMNGVIKNLRNDKRKQEHQRGKSCKNRNIKLPPTELGIRTHEGKSMDAGTLNSLIASRPNIFQEFCYQTKPNENS